MMNGQLMRILFLGKLSLRKRLLKIKKKRVPKEVHEPVLKNTKFNVFTSTAGFSTINF